MNHISDKDYGIKEWIAIALMVIIIVILSPLIIIDYIVENITAL